MCSMDTKQALHDVSPEKLSLVMKAGNCSCVGMRNFEGTDWWQIRHMLPRNEGVWDTLGKSSKEGRRAHE